MRGFVIGLLAVVAVTACGKVPQAAPPASGYRLYEAALTAPNAPEVAIIDTRSHATLGQLPLGTPSADGRHYYSVGAGVLKDFDPQTGVTVHTLPLARPYTLPPATLGGIPGGLSQDGRWLVLENTTTSESHFLVVDTSFARKPITIDLPGAFRFDAISNDGQRLYLIQYSSATQYFVRFVDVAGGQLNPTIVFDKSDGSPAMSGLRLMGVASPDGHWLYSVYARKDKSAFVHALWLDNPIAYCIDLPGSGYSSDPTSKRWSLALSPDGSRLYATNAATGEVAVINVGGQALHTVTQTARLSLAAAGNAGAKDLGTEGTVVSADGSTLAFAGETGITWVDTATLHSRASALSNQRVWSLALSPDGSTLFALTDSGLIAQLSMVGQHEQSAFQLSLGQPMGLIRVEPIA